MTKHLRARIRTGLLAAALLSSPLAFQPGYAAGEQPHPSSQLVETIQAFLGAYASGNEALVLSYLTAGQPHVYGSDAAEFVDSREGCLEMLRADQRLWGHGATFGPLRNVSEERSRDLASIFFDTDFLLGGHAVPVRFAMTWRLEHGAWKLVQSSNVVPTVGQSAALLLKAHQ